MSKGKDTADFLKGLNITEMEKPAAEKAAEINDFLVDVSKNRKYGKSDTGRLAIHMAHYFLEIIQEAEEQEKEDVKDVMDVKKKMVDML